MAMKQLNLFKDSTKLNFGGDLLKGKRKSKRPLNPKLPVHLVLRADITKSGTLIQWQTLTKFQIQKWSKRFQITIQERAIVGNHIHLLIQIRTRECYNHFIRALCGALAQKTKLKWQTRPFTRIVKLGRDLQNVTKYIIQNQLEAWRIIPYQPRSTAARAGP
jgi:REP element-mobilizing transposase RayT